MPRQKAVKRRGKPVSRRSAAAQGKSKSTYVLVHGAWHGGWCWKKVVPALRAAGHAVYTPTLTGLGERAHLANPAIDLAMHIADVVNLLEAEELEKVVLVGHSYGGMVITGVADRAASRLRRVVYLDAFLPENGRCLLDYLQPDRRTIIKQGEMGGFVDPLPLKIFGIDEVEDVAWVLRHEMRQSYRTFAQPIHFTGKGGADLPRTYVHCTHPPTGSFDQFAARVREDPAWKFHELKTGHDCMITDPKSVIRILLENA
ncbi:MAG TPA: alpha/beta hydrolase family protein [Burkholderiales bacterium]|nr:alpha/beta hydrolase family protein [Burkholderiales bacterium]